MLKVEKYEQAPPPQAYLAMDCFDYFRRSDPYTQRTYPSHYFCLVHENYQQTMIMVIVG
jgi:hypothetical protein